MPIFREIPPTAGWPIRTKDLFSALSVQAGNNSLKNDFLNYLKVPYAQITYSGTSALYLILESLKVISDKKTIIIPSYVCPLVALAGLKAGLKVIYCDIARNSFDYDYKQLQSICANNSDILAIVAVHLAGIPAEISLLNEIASQSNIFVIEDCAQAMGAEYKGKPVGSIGDFSFFSLCRGKGLTIYEGGIIIAKDKNHGPTIAKTVEKLTKNNSASETLKILELFGYWIFYRPLLFWYIFRLPESFWNLLGKPQRAAAEEYNTDFEVRLVSDYRSALAHINFKKLSKCILEQRQKARYFIDNLNSVSGVRILTETNGSTATYPYLTVIFDDPVKQKKALHLLRHLGLGASQIYIKPINEYDYLKGRLSGQTSANASFIAEKTITLTTNTFLRAKDAERIIKLLKKIINQ